MCYALSYMNMNAELHNSLENMLVLHSRRGERENSSSETPHVHASTHL